MLMSLTSQEDGFGLVVLVLKRGRYATGLGVSTTRRSAMRPRRRVGRALGDVSAAPPPPAGRPPRGLSSQLTACLLLIKLYPISRTVLL